MASRSVIGSVLNGGSMTPFSQRRSSSSPESQRSMVMVPRPCVNAVETLMSVETKNLPVRPVAVTGTPVRLMIEPATVALTPVVAVRRLTSAPKVWAADAADVAPVIETISGVTTGRPSESTGRRTTVQICEASTTPSISIVALVVATATWTSSFWPKPARASNTKSESNVRVGRGLTFTVTRLSGAPVSTTS